MNEINIQKDRKRTEKLLLDAVGRIVRKDGFKKLGVNLVAEESGLSKVLIYRYFGDLNGLIAEYIRQKDFWSSYPMPDIRKEELAGFLKTMFRSQMRQMRTNGELAELNRWEITDANTFSSLAEKSREENGLRLIAMVQNLTKSGHDEIAAVATLLSAAITYLVLFENYGNAYNGIDIKSEKGREQILSAVDKLIDLWIKSEVK